MEITVLPKKSLGQLLHDLGFRDLLLSDGNNNYAVKHLDAKVIERNLMSVPELDFPIYTEKNSKGGRSFLAHPGIFADPLYFFFKAAKYRPDKETFVVKVNVIRKIAEGMKPGSGCEEDMTVEEIKSLIANLSGGVFEKIYRAIDSVSESGTICR